MNKLILEEILKNKKLNYLIKASKKKNPKLLWTLIEREYEFEFYQSFEHLNKKSYNFDYFIKKQKNKRLYKVKDEMNRLNYLFDRFSKKLSFKSLCKRLNKLFFKNVENAIHFKHRIIEKKQVDASLKGFESDSKKEGPQRDKDGFYYHLIVIYASGFSNVSFIKNAQESMFDNSINNLSKLKDLEKLPNVNDYTNQIPLESICIRVKKKELIQEIVYAFIIKDFYGKIFDSISSLLLLDIDEHMGDDSFELGGDSPLKSCCHFIQTKFIENEEINDQFEDSESSESEFDSSEEVFTKSHKNEFNQTPKQNNSSSDSQKEEESNNKNETQSEQANEEDSDDDANAQKQTFSKIIDCSEENLSLNDTIQNHFNYGVSKKKIVNPFDDSKLFEDNDKNDACSEKDQSNFILSEDLTSTQFDFHRAKDISSEINDSVLTSKKFKSNANRENLSLNNFTDKIGHIKSNIYASILMKVKQLNVNIVMDFWKAKKKLMKFPTQNLQKYSPVQLMNEIKNSKSIKFTFSSEEKFIVKQSKGNNFILLKFHYIIDFTNCSTNSQKTNEKNLDDVQDGFTEFSGEIKSTSKKNAKNIVFYLIHSILFDFTFGY